MVDSFKIKENLSGILSRNLQWRLALPPSDIFENVFGNACPLKTSGAGLSSSMTVASSPSGPLCRFGNGSLPTPLKTGRPWSDVVTGCHLACLSGQNVTSPEPAISRSGSGDVRGS